MKINRIKQIQSGLIVVGLLILTACQYEEIAPRDNYPEEKIYLPAARAAEAEGGVYLINEVTQAMPDYFPTPGSPFRYLIDNEANKFEIPLAVYRSGVHLGGSISVAVAINRDTIANLIATGDEAWEDVQILPEGKYSIDPAVEIPGGKTNAPFRFWVDFEFLRQQTPQKYAIAVSISCPKKEVNPDLSTVVILIDTRIMLPIPGFEPVIDALNAKKVAFRNTSNYALACVWNFGDGSVVEGQGNVEHTYTANGVYEVTLKTTGLYGDEVTYSKNVTIKNPE
jgi:hypothetical protein